MNFGGDPPRPTVAETPVCHRPDISNRTTKTFSEITLPGETVRVFLLLHERARDLSRWLPCDCFDVSFAP